MDGDINTELSGSTVVVVVLYGDRLISFNVGDSRAILLRQVAATEKELGKEGESESS